MKALAGLAVGELVVVGLPPSVFARVIEVKIDLAMKDSACIASIDESKKVSKRKRDVLVWNVASTCTTAQEVHVCASGGKPLRKCNGEPAHAKIGKEFTIEAGAAGTPASAIVTCHVKWAVLDEHPASHAKKYVIDVLNGPADAELDCPEKTVCVGPVCPEGSELALEVEP